MAYEEVTRIWELYEKGKAHHNQKKMYSKADRCHKMYEGDQWDGIDGVDKTKLPMENFIAPVVKYKVASVAMNGFTITYNPMGGGDEAVCKVLNDHAAQKWEQQKMDTRMWEMAQEAAIVGESFLFFYDRYLDTQMIDGTAVYLGDEQQPDLQKQPYIIIYERRLVRDVVADAKKYHVKKSEIDNIVADEDNDTLVGDKVEVKGDHGKCSCLLYLTKKNGEIHFTRCTKTVVYQPETRMAGMRMYPMVNLIWNRAHNSARGIGEVWPMIPNQIEANKMLYRRLENTKMTAFNKLVYVEGLVENPENLTEAGTPIRIREGSAQSVNDYITFLQTPAIGNDAAALQQEIIDRTRDLANAGDAAMGDINPEQASGAAIAAVRDAQAIPLNEQQNAIKQLVEDIGKVWLDMLCTYSPDGILANGQLVAMPRQIRAMQMQIKIDVSPRDPFSKFAQEQTLAAMYQSGAITLEEYVDALDDDSNTPKAKLQKILTERGKRNVQPGMLPPGNAGGGTENGGWPGSAGIPVPGM